MRIFSKLSKLPSLPSPAATLALCLVAQLAACGEDSGSGDDLGTAGSGGTATTATTATTGTTGGSDDSGATTDPGFEACDPALVPEGMICVPAGDFTMGSTFETDQEPARTVTLSAFWMDTREVTVSAYQACVDAGMCEAAGAGQFCNAPEADRGDHPINCVNYAQAAAYCAFAGKRLPTEAEWEKGARGDDAREYPWGPELPDCTRCVMNDGRGNGCGATATFPAGAATSPASVSPYGFEDMAGNVQEFVADWYGPYDAAATLDPTGPDSGTNRIVRGGTWTSNTGKQLRATARATVLAEGAGRNVDGVRCAQTPTQG